MPQQQAGNNSVSIPSISVPSAAMRPTTVASPVTINNGPITYRSVRYRNATGNLLLTEDSLVFLGPHHTNGTTSTTTTTSTTRPSSRSILLLEWQSLHKITANVATTTTGSSRTRATLKLTDTHGRDMKLTFGSRPILEQARRDIKARWKAAHHEISLPHYEEEDFSESIGSGEDWSQIHTTNNNNSTMNIPQPQPPPPQQQQQRRQSSSMSRSEQTPRRQGRSARNLGVDDVEMGDSSRGSSSQQQRPSFSTTRRYSSAKIPRASFRTSTPDGISSPFEMDTTSTTESTIPPGQHYWNHQINGNKNNHNSQTARKNAPQRHQEEGKVEEGLDSSSPNNNNKSPIITLLPHDQIMLPRRQSTTRDGNITTTNNGHYLLDCSTFDKSQQIKVTPVDRNLEQGPSHMIRLDDATAMQDGQDQQDDVVLQYNNNHNNNNRLPNVVQYKEYFYFAGYRISKNWCMGSLLFAALGICILFLVAVVMVVLLMTIWSDEFSSSDSDSNSNSDTDSGGRPPLTDDFYAPFFETIP